MADDYSAEFPEISRSEIACVRDGLHCGVPTITLRAESRQCSSWSASAFAGINIARTVSKPGRSCRSLREMCLAHPLRFANAVEGGSGENRTLHLERPGFKTILDWFIREAAALFHDRSPTSVNWST